MNIRGKNVRKKNTIQIGHKDFLYPIFNDLTKYGRTEMCFTDKKKHTSAAQSVGSRIKNLRDNGFIYPPFPFNDKMIVTIPKEIEVIERKGFNISTFILKKK